MMFLEKFLGGCLAILVAAMAVCTLCFATMMCVDTYQKITSDHCITTTGE